MTAYAFGLFVLLGWALGDIFGGLSSRKIGAFKTSFLVSVFGILIFLPKFASESSMLSELTPWLLGLNIILSLFWTTGNVILNVGMTTAYPSIVASIGMSFAGVVVILNSIVFDNAVGFLQWCAIALIALGVILTGIDIRRNEVEGKKLIRSIILGLSSMICWALYYTFIKPVADAVGWFLPLYIAIAVSTLATWIGSRQKNAFDFKSIPLLTILFCFLSAFLLRSSDFILNWSIKENFVDVVAPLGGASPVLFAILSFFVFKERLKALQILGVLLVLTGIVTLAFVS